MVKINQNTVAVWWESRLNIDADGAPNAYAPAYSNLQGLDYLANAGKPGNWWALVLGADMQPIIQSASDPCPGYFISTTALVDKTRPMSDPRRYVDSSTVPYLSIPSDAIHGFTLRMGDVGFAYCRSTGQLSAAVCADIGPRGKYGEGSIALAKALGIPSDPKHGGVDTGVVCAVFKGSNKGWPRANQDVAQQVQDIINQSGYEEYLK